LGEFNIIVCIAGVIYLIYSVLTKDKVNTLELELNKVIVIDKERYLDLKLKFDILNSILTIIIGLIITILDLGAVYVYTSGILFGVIGCLLIPVAKRKGYIKSSIA
jgi:energy-converting hydrogenase Eha subunit C